MNMTELRESQARAMRLRDRLNAGEDQAAAAHAEGFLTEGETAQRVARIAAAYHAR